MDHQPALLLATAYAPPVSYFALLYKHRAERIALEAHENYVKQTYRNRCRILAPNGVQALTLPIEQPRDLKCPIQEVRLSEHGSWRHLHQGALWAAYGSSPFFEFYADDLLPLYDRRWSFLWDFNLELMHRLVRLLGLSLPLHETEDFTPLGEHPQDYRYSLRPKGGTLPEGYTPLPYYQVFRERYGFVPELSIYDLLFEMGPESLLVLRDSFPTAPTETPNP